MERSLALAALLLAGCAGGGGGGKVEVLSQAPTPRLTRLAVASVTGTDDLRGGERARELAAALDRRFDAVAAGDADTVMSSTELGLQGASPGALAELRRATGAEGVVFATMGPRSAWLELAVLDATSGDLLLRVRARPASGPSFTSFRAAAAAGAQALAPLSRRGRSKPSAPEDDELPPP
jgi:hypothetical protein